ncbi:AER030Cp [Eremothecium gossypii ATCC 10895]|uniref:AER030Cp n=1 Tax=Eremothecium gossypii (strain ATCC 10895 / CBS 109.51 / FGSC 9923 / NRRL Y-1056) TaxID=284811 RepID=Q757I3_EREGS|nr:AER030Cp [Eremothecium gossypii ATCC 10895]AAS52714.1 AER030Cp [Eremothecium gossypii ATCC 10895]
MADANDSSDSNSTSSFVSALILYGIIGLVYTLIFLALRKRYRRVYEPRTLDDVRTLQPSERVESAPAGYVWWLPHLLYKPHKSLLQHMGVDAYFFARYLAVFGTLALIGCFILLPILLPVNAAGGRHLRGFERISFSNVAMSRRLYAHVFLSWIFFGLVLYVIYRELYYYVSMRQALQTSPYYSSLLQSRTVLFTDVRGGTDAESVLRGAFTGVEEVVYAKDHTELRKLVKERNKTANKYESALNKVVNKSVKVRRKAELKGNTVLQQREDLKDDDFERYVKKRPTHRLGKIPCVGEKVDTLKHCASRLGSLNSRVKSEQEEWETSQPLNTCFVIFSTQRDAQEAYQRAPVALPKGSYDRCIIGCAPDDVNWDSLSMSKSVRRSKRLVGNSILTAMIIFWAIPVAVVGCISNINFLTEKVHFLRFINNLPDVLMGLITSLLPTIMLAVLMSLVPIFIQLVANKTGSISRQETQLYCQRWFYAFQVVHVVLVVMLASSAASTVTAIIDDPNNAFEQLAQNMPLSANFYLSYVMLFAFIFASGVLLQLTGFVLSFILGRILDSTPRQKWTRYNTLNLPTWGVMYPLMELQVCIMLAYAIVTPVLLIISTLALLFAYVAYMYVFNYVYGLKHDYKGRNYVNALFQVFVGLYLAEVFLFALFIMGRAWGPLVLNVIMLAFTVLVHLYLQRRFLPLVDAVPLSLLDGAAGSVGKDQGWAEVVRAGRARPLDGLVALTNRLTGAATPAHPAPVNPDAEKAALSRSAPAAASSALARVKNFFHPSAAYNYDLAKSRLPDTYDKPLEYAEGYTRSAYTDPCIRDKEPVLWVPEDPMGVAARQAAIAEQHGVKVSTSHTGFDEKGAAIYTDNPPDYTPYDYVNH